jgi:predicted O-methyltransferase YrrM
MGIEDLSPLDAVFRTVLESMYAREPQRGVDGLPHPVDRFTRVSAAEGMALYRWCVDAGVTATLEIGLAYGFSAAFLLAALNENGGGRHVAVDPYQTRDWHGVGAATAARLSVAAAGLDAYSFTCLETRSEAALVDLQRRGETFGLVFIDGYHRFDDVLVDFTLAARMVPVGGLIVLHDRRLDSVKAVASWIGHDRPDFAKVTMPCRNLFAVRRVGEDERDWRHFVRFPMR